MVLFAKLAFECSLVECMLFFLVIVFTAPVDIRWQKNRNESKPFIMNYSDRFLLLELEFKLTSKSQREITLIRGNQAACWNKEALDFCYFFQG